MQSFRCLVQRRFPLAIPSISTLLTHIRAKRPVTSRVGTRSVFRSRRSLISEQLIPPLAKPFFDSPGPRSVKVTPLAISSSMPGSPVALMGGASRALMCGQASYCSGSEEQQGSSIQGKRIIRILGASSRAHPACTSSNHVWVIKPRQQQISKYISQTLQIINCVIVREAPRLGR
jgi:hypothetical protein